MITGAPFRKLNYLATALTLAAVTACGQPLKDQQSPEPPAHSPSPAPTGPVSYRGLPVGDLEIANEGRVKIKLVVDLAETDQARQIGLMNVPEMAENYGMAFLFGAPGRTGFHMKNTLIPLDIAFWNQSMIIVDVLHMPPCKKEPCPVFIPKNDFVGSVEMNSGLLKKHGAEVGDQVTLSRRGP